MSKKYLLPLSPRRSSVPIHRARPPYPQHHPARTRPSSSYTTTLGQTIPITSHIPSTPCACQDDVPPDLDIDRKRSLVNTVAPYTRHIVIATGKDDWASKIESEEGMAKTLKEMTKPGGEWHDVRGASSYIPTS
ncbi:MAG: hypothetical protein Q9220_006903 [cf. Caloplaca sp. 1 TL-2023]